MHQKSARTQSREAHKAGKNDLIAIAFAAFEFVSLVAVIGGASGNVRKDLMDYCQADSLGMVNSD